MLTYEYILSKKERASEAHSKKTENLNNTNNTNPNDNEKIETNFLNKIEKMNFILPSKKEKKLKKNSATIFISEEFPLKFNVFCDSKFSINYS